MMKISKRCEYGLKAAVRLAQGRGSGYLQSREIAQSEGLPPKFLESILLALRSSAILESKVGAGGGYRLARPASEIAVMEVLLALEPPEEEPSESDELPGSLGSAAHREVEARIARSIDRAIGGLMLADLLEISSAGESGRAPEIRTFGTPGVAASP